MFARRPGKNNTLAPITTGSHLDTQLSGEKFDGVLGVLPRLEVIRTLNDHKIETDAPVEVCVWTNEEGTRFAPSMMGSGVFAGAFDIDKVKAVEDTEGATLGAELERIGYAGDKPAGGHEMGAYFELHIEQGPILEAEEKVIDVVGAANGQGWYDITVTSQGSHAGPNPIPARKDALVTASKILQEIKTASAMTIRPLALPPSASCRPVLILETWFREKLFFRSTCATRRLKPWHIWSRS